METQKNHKFTKRWGQWIFKFVTRKWYFINYLNNTEYGVGNENSRTVKFESKDIKSNFCYYSDAHILVTGDITVTYGNPDTRGQFESCAPLTKYITHIND